MAEGTSVQTVLVTGATGFVATHIIKQLQEEGKYAVRGTVRSLKNEEKNKQLKELVPDATYPLELVEAELTKEEGWKEAVQGCTYVCHVASPFPLASPRNEDELIVPAVSGTLNVLKACTEAGTVKRVVVTSSCVSIGLVDESHELTEDDWQPEDVSSAYTKSKIRAERAAWDYVKNLEDDKKFELAVINPSLIVGPLLTRSNSGSLDLLKAMLTKSIPALLDVKLGVIDVRDVAAAHIVAMEIAEAAGNRHILAERVMSFPEVAEIVSREFTPQGYNIPSFKLPKPLAFIMKFVSSDVKEMYPQMGKDIKYSKERMLNVLKIQPHDTPKSILESCYSLIESGAVDKTAGYLGPPESRKQPVEENTTKETTEEPTNTEETPQEPAKTEETPQEPAKTEETPQEPAKTEETPQEPAKTEETPQEPAKTEETPREPTLEEPEKTVETPQQPKEETTEQTPEEPVKVEEAPQEPVKTEETPQEPEKTEETPQEPEKTEDTPQEPEKEKTTEETTDEQEQ